MAKFLAQVLIILGPKLMEWLGGLVKKYRQSAEIKKEADEQIKKAEQHEKDPSSIDINDIK